MSSLQVSLLDSASTVESSEKKDLSVQSASPTKKKKIKLYTTSVVIVSFIIFLVGAAKGILFPALWSLCEDLGGDEVDLGFIVAIHSLGKAVIATRMGIISDQYRHRFALILAVVLLLCGSFLWAMCPYMGGLPMLYFAQFLLGLFGGVIGVARSFVVEQTQPVKRTYVLGRLTAVQYSGFCMSPMLGAILIEVGSSITDFLKFALPAFFLFFLASVGLYLLIYEFMDIAGDDELTEADVVNPIAPNIVTKANNNIKDVENVNGHIIVHHSNNSNNGIGEVVQIRGAVSASEYPALSKSVTDATNTDEETLRLRNVVFWVLILVTFVTHGIMGDYEACASKIILSDYDMSYLALGAIYLGAGCIATLQLLYFKEIWTNRFTDVMIMLIGLSFMAVFQLLIINWTPTTEPQLWQFCIALYSMLTVGFPVTNCANLGSFSILQTIGHQSTYQGHFALSEALSHIIVPILAGFLEQDVRRFASFSVVLMLTALSIVMLLYTYLPMAYFTNRNPLNIYGTPTGLPAILASKSMRYMLMTVASIMILAGFFTLVTSGIGGVEDDEN